MAEFPLTFDYVNHFDLEAIKLALQGVSIIVASMDDGAPGQYAKENGNLCGYYPSWPASSPYVTTVGATMGPEYKVPSAEVVCSVCSGGTSASIITSGGGASNLYPIPPWQAAAVNKYMTSVSPSPQAGFNTTGRMYPDVSLDGNQYVVLIGGTWSVVR